MDLLSFVAQPTWKEFLIDLVATEKMDPWDLDLVEISDAYLKKVREMQQLDLRIPANVILASALLLRFKADALTLEEEVEEQGFAEELQHEDLPDLVFRLNRPRSRKLTLEELMQSVEEVMRQGRKPVVKQNSPIVMVIDLPKEDLHHKITTVLEKCVALKDSEGVVKFSDLLEEKTPEQMVRRLLPVLHLVQEQKLHVWQDDFFGEIFLKVLAEEAVAKTQTVN